MKKSIFIIALFTSVLSLLSSCVVREDYGYRNHAYRHYDGDDYYHRDNHRDHDDRGNYHDRY